MLPVDLSWVNGDIFCGVGVFYAIVDLVNKLLLLLGVFGEVSSSFNKIDLLIFPFIFLSRPFYGS